VIGDDCCVRLWEPTRKWQRSSHSGQVTRTLDIEQLPLAASRLNSPLTPESADSRPGPLREIHRKRTVQARLDSFFAAVPMDT
jgi:hypothetical protein